MPKKTERAVLVTTEHRGVFFGYTDDTSGDIINLRAARNCIYWSSDLKGFLGLATVGPNKNCKAEIPPKWEGERLWVVALIGETQQQEDKFAALQREIIGECLPDDALEKHETAGD